MSENKSLHEMFDDRKERSSRYNLRYHRCPDTPSECDLVIDDDYEENVPKKQVKRTKGIRARQEPTNIVCDWVDCGKLFTEHENFINHVEEHATECEYINDMLSCGFEGCVFQTVFQDLFMKHTSFHSYHERLKNIGINVVERLRLPKCTSLVHFVQNDVYDYECKWNRCTGNFNTIFEFVNHIIAKHVKPLSTYCAKGEFNKCEWLGCNLKFTSQYKLRDHMRTHSTEKVIACPTCGNMYSSKTRFADHRKRQIPIELQSFQCSECSKLFATERLLRDHMRSHINHYKCNFCDMTCSRPSMLASHIRYRHMNVRPFKCSLCEHASITKANLETHLQTHCAENLIVCEFCDYSCRTPYTLERHHHKEHGEGLIPMYKCHVCPKRCFRGAQLTRHLIKEHDFYWPSGHSRFRYKEDADGFRRLQTVRYESLEVTQEMMSAKPPVINDAKYEMTVSTDSTGRMPSYVLRVKQVNPDNLHSTDKDVIINIDDVDAEGNVINREVVESKEIFHDPDDPE